MVHFAYILDTSTETHGRTGACLSGAYGRNITYFCVWELEIKSYIIQGGREETKLALTSEYTKCQSP